MKGSFTKTTILMVCTALGLTIGIGSAFGQKLADQSQVKGEVPLDQSQVIQKKQLVPEHLKPSQTEEPKETKSPQIKGEKPVDPSRNHLEPKERLIPETPNPNPKPSPRQPADSNPPVPKQQENPNETTSDRQPDKESPIPDQKAEEEEQEEPKNPSDDKNSLTKEEPSDSKEQPSTKQPLPKANNHVPSTQPDNQPESKEPKAKNEKGHEINIPEKIEVESSDGKKVDITSVIEDIFGEVHASKEETEAIQKRMENERPNPEIAMQKSNPLSEEQSAKEENHLPRTEQHGVMPMTASNDLHGVLIGLAMATAGILYILFRKGE